MPRPVLTPLDGVEVIPTAAYQDHSVTRVKLAADALPTAATVATAQSTSSTTYVDLATVGPVVTLLTGTLVLVGIRCGISFPVNGINMSVAVSGATTIAAGSGTLTSTTSTLRLELLSVNAGVNTFTAKYQSPAGDAVTFSNRHLFVMLVDANG